MYMCELRDEKKIAHQHCHNSGVADPQNLPIFYLGYCENIVTLKSNGTNNNNNNNNTRTIFIVLSSWPLKVIARVHSVHLMNAAQRTSGCRPSDQATW